jgi:lysine 6-dehydrogenase
MVDFFDEDKGITSMARATASPGAIVALMLARGEIRGKWFIPLEDAIRKDTFDKYIAELSRRGVNIAGPSRRTLA